MAERTYILLYDGVCGFCNDTVWFVLKRDPERRFRFAPLQSDYAREVLAQHGKNADDLDTVYLVTSAGGEAEDLRWRARAILKIAAALGWPWKAILVFWPLPTVVLDFGYRIFARLRYRLFGRLDECPVPTQEERSRFLGFETSAPAEGQGSRSPVT